MRRFKVQDGGFGTTGLGYHGRLDVGISKEHIDAKDMASQAGVGVPAEGADASTRIILDYGWGQYEDRQRARAAGFDFHLVKPIEPDAVARLLANRANDAGAVA